MANSDYSFPHHVSKTVLNSRVFSLSYDPDGEFSLFTLGGIDPRIMTSASHTDWAKNAAGVQWAVQIDKGHLGPISIE